MGWQKIETRGHRKGGGPVDYLLRLSKQGEKKLAVTMSEKCLRLLRWKQGDRVYLLVDEESGMIGLQRTVSIDGRTLSSAGGSKDSKSKHVTIKITMEPSMLDRCVNGQPRVFHKDDLIIDDDSDIVAVELIG